MLVGGQEGHLAYKNVCFRTPWDTVTAVNVSGRGSLQPEGTKPVCMKSLYVLSHDWATRNRGCFA